MWNPEESRELVRAGIVTVDGLKAHWTWAFANFATFCQECAAEIKPGELMLYRFHGLDTVNDWRCRACGILIKPLPKLVLDYEAMQTIKPNLDDNQHGRSEELIHSLPPTLLPHDE